jgi:hypothetical protein
MRGAANRVNRFLFPIILPLVSMLAMGCSSLQQKGTVTIEGRGAELLTDRGDPLMQTGKYARKVSADFATGYAKGISDQVKREYWAQQASQGRNKDGHVVLYDATIPSRTDANGVKRTERQVVVPIVE